MNLPAADNGSVLQFNLDRFTVNSIPSYRAGLDATGDRWIDVFNADWRKGIRQQVVGFSQHRHTIAMQNILTIKIGLGQSPKKQESLK